jgi:hypothetical protein
MKTDLGPLVLSVLMERPGGDLVCRADYKRSELFRLAPGMHHMSTVCREIAQAHGGYIQPPPEVLLGVTFERRGHVEVRWKRRFYRAWRALCDQGYIEAPSLVPIAEDKTGRAMDLADGLFIDRGCRRYVRVTQKGMNSFLRSPSDPPIGGTMRRAKNQFIGKSGWEEVGMSRATWYRLGKPTTKPSRVTQKQQALLLNVSVRSIQRARRIQRLSDEVNKTGQGTTP